MVVQELMVVVLEILVALAAEVLVVVALPVAGKR